MAYEVVSREFGTKKSTVRTVFGTPTAMNIGEKALVITIMRAGEPMASGAIDLLDELGIHRKIGVVDAKRSEGGRIVPGRDVGIELGSFKVPRFDGATAVIFDPMLATGSTVSVVLDRLRSDGHRLKKTVVCSVIASEYGAQTLLCRYGRACDLRLYVMALDRKLDRRGYIVPGLGDAGDRAFHSG